MAVDGLKILENGYDSVVSALTDIAGNVTPTQVAIGTIVAGAGVGGVIVAKLQRNGNLLREKHLKRRKPKGEGKGIECSSVSKNMKKDILKERKKLEKRLHENGIKQEKIQRKEPAKLTTLKRDSPIK